MIKQRMCVSCRQMKNKSELIRVVKVGNSISIDKTGKLDGRGAYVCNNDTCINMCEKKRLFNKSFKCNIPNEIYLELKEYNE